MKKKKPDFSTVESFFLLDANFISNDLRAELLLHLKKSPLNQAQQDGIIEFAGDMWQSLAGDNLQSGKRQLTQIKEVSQNARRLLASLRKLEQPAMQALHSHTDYLAQTSAPPIRLDEEILSTIRQPGGSLASSAWDWIQALEQAAEYTTERFQIGKQSKPAQLQARGYVAMLARYVADTTGTMPPTDRSAWFVAFMECLGAEFGLPMGSTLIKSGVKAAG